MTETDPTAGFYGSSIETGVGGAMVNFGGVEVRALDAAAYVMMFRTYVLKKVSTDRTELAQQHLEKIRKARQILMDLRDMKRFVDTGDSDNNRIPITPDMVRFIHDEMNITPHVYISNVLFDDDIAKHLPESARDYYGWVVDGDGNLVGDDMPEGHEGENRPDYGSQGSSGGFAVDFSGAMGEFFGSWGGGSDTVASTGRNDIHVIHENSVDELTQNVNNYVDQISDTNNLFMTKFRAVVNNMNAALEGANSLLDKSHDMQKNLMSRW